MLTNGAGSAKRVDMKLAPLLTPLLTISCIGQIESSPAGGGPGEVDGGGPTTDGGRDGADAGQRPDGSVVDDPDAAAVDLADGSAPAGTPVAVNGQLSVCGTRLCNQHGNPIQLRGMSTHGLQWYGWGDCVTEASLDALAGPWGADILRVSLYVQEGGYETDPAGFTAQVDQIIGELVDRGLYVLIDWHQLSPGDPWYNVDAARTYFTHMAETHGHLPNVLYEIANEPNGVSWSAIKSYAEEIIPVIRAIDPDGVVVVGTRGWSSFGLSEGGGPDEVIDDPVAHANVMYTFHFYAASHGDFYRDAVIAASASLPIFVTEWGTQEYTGDGGNDFTSAQAYIDWMAEAQVSWTSWNYSDDSRSGAAFVSGTCSAGGPFTGANLKAAGQWVKERIGSPPDDFPTD
jgi:endoglucanase